LTRSWGLSHFCVWDHQQPSNRQKALQASLMSSSTMWRARYQFTLFFILDASFSPSRSGCLSNFSGIIRERRRVWKLTSEHTSFHTLSSWAKTPYVAHARVVSRAIRDPQVRSSEVHRLCWRVAVRDSIHEQMMRGSIPVRASS